jgi:hypothetical protein
VLTRDTTSNWVTNASFHLIFLRPCGTAREMFTNLTLKTKILKEKFYLNTGVSFRATFFREFLL